VKAVLVAAALVSAALIVVAGASAAQRWSGGTVVLQQAPGVGQSTFVMYRTDKTVCTNWGHYTFFHVGTNALSIRRGLLQFDLSSLPHGARILSATLSVYETDTLRGSGVVGVHRVTTPWTEGSGVNTCTGDGATWLTTGLGADWLAPGGDIAGPELASVVKQAGDTPGWDTFSVTSLVRGWVSGAYPNDGLMLKLDDESFSPCTTITNCPYWGYASNEYKVDPTLRPKLTVTYQ
jgi:hypothetical protein